MFALYATKKFRIDSLSDKAVLYDCSGQTHLHLILQNIHKNMKKCWVLAPLVECHSRVQKEAWAAVFFLSCQEEAFSVLALSQFLLRDPSECPESDQVPSSCATCVHGVLSPLFSFPLSFELLSCILFKLYNETLHLL